MSEPLALQYVTLDVFTSTRYAGNPLAIVRLPSTQHLTQAQKQIIAREFNYSETVILHEGDSGDTEHAIDIFMSDRELPFAGHPTIGSVCYLASIQSVQDGRGSLKTKSGVIPYRHDPISKIAHLNIPHDVRFHEATLSSDKLAAAGIPEHVVKGLVAPVAIVSIVKGVTFALLELHSTEALSGVSGSVDPALVTASLDKLWYDGFMSTKYFVNHGKREDGTTILSTRMFMNKGMLEDPATGSASCALCVHLARQMTYSEEANRDKLVTYKFEIDQGVDMGRPSKIYVEVTLDSKSGIMKDVVLGGSAVKIMEGTILI